MPELLISAADLEAWIAREPDGAEIEYHRGFLARDCSEAPTNGWTADEAFALRAVRRVAWRAGPGSPHLESIEGEHGRPLREPKTIYAKLTQRRLFPLAENSDYSYLLQLRGAPEARAAAMAPAPKVQRHHVYRPPGPPKRAA